MAAWAVLADLWAEDLAAPWAVVLEVQTHLPVLEAVVLVLVGA